MMPIPADLSSLTKAFADQSMDGHEFGHVQHVEVAFELLGHHDFVDAASIYCRGIQAIAVKAGAPTKFNLTITLAFLSLIAERRNDLKSGDFAAFRERNPDLFEGNALIPPYSAERLFSDKARSMFLLPDIAA